VIARAAALAALGVIAAAIGAGLGYAALALMAATSWYCAPPRRARRPAPVGSPLRAARVGGRRGDTCCVPGDSLLCRSRFYMWTPSISLVIALWTAYTKPFTAT